MVRVLITGMSGTGKSTVIQHLVDRGYLAIDADDDQWSEWVIDPGDGPGGHAGELDWVWREERIRQLLSTVDADPLFVSGCASNQGKFYTWFDHIILLSAPASVIVERLASRTNNTYGKDPDEVAEVLGYLETVEPVLRRGATLEIDTGVSIDRVIETILRVAQPDHERASEHDAPPFAEAVPCSPISPSGS